MSHSISVVNPCPDDAADIVARLRCQSPYLNGSSAEMLMNEAADEIERLRAWIKRIDAINDNPADFNVMIDNACADALSGKINV
jgi:hypothetical protein